MSTRSLRLALSLLMLTACDPDDGPEGTDSEAVETDSDSGGEDTEDGADEFAGADLMACGVASDCPTMWYHLGPEPPESLQCAATRVASGEHGALLGSLNIGPSPDSTETFVVLLGDGTALVQDRVGPNGADSEDHEAWSVVAHKRCEVGGSGSPELAEACAMDPVGDDCGWTVWAGLLNCEDVEALACDDLPSALTE